MLLFKLEMLIHFFKFASPSGDSKNLKLCHVEPKAQKRISIRTTMCLVTIEVLKKYSMRTQRKYSGASAKPN